MMNQYSKNSQSKKFPAITMMVFMICVSCLIKAQKSKINIPSSSKQVIHGRIIDETGNPLIAQVQVWYFDIQDVVFSFDTTETNGRTDNLITVDYSNQNGYYSVRVPSDTVLFIVTKGPEWELIYKKMIINPREFDGIEYNVAIKRLYDLGSLGWYGGDTHMHSIHSDGRQSPSELVHTMKGVGLTWGILTDHNSISGKKEWLAEGQSDFIPILGAEITTEASETSIENGYGHFNQTFITELSGITANPNIWARAIFNDHTNVQNSIDLTHAHGGLLIINHPYQNWDWAGRFKSWGEVKNFDGIEIWNCEPPHSLTTSTFDPNLMNRNTLGVQSWFAYLNSGKKLSGLAGSDTHDAYGTNAYPKGKYFWNTMAGNPRTYAFMEDFNELQLKEAIKHGRLFLTSGFGPILLVTAGGETQGNIIRVEKDEKLDVAIEVLANHPLLNSDDAVRIIYNGKIIKSFSTEGSIIFEKSIPLNIIEDGWIVVEAFGEWPMFAMTNPIFVDVPPFGDWPIEEWVEPENLKLWNKYMEQPEITIPDGPSNWENSQYIYKLFDEIN